MMTTIRSMEARPEVADVMRTAGRTSPLSPTEAA